MKAISFTLLAILGIGAIAVIFYSLGKQGALSGTEVANLRMPASVNRPQTNQTGQPVAQVTPTSKPEVPAKTITAEAPADPPVVQANNFPTPERFANSNANISRPYVNSNISRNRSVVFNGSLVAGANSLAWQGFYVSNGGNVFGRLEGSGGLRGEFECFILDDNGLTALRNGGSAGTYFNSNGRLVVVSVFARLAHGQYYLVVRNQSPWVSRTVSGTLFLDQ